MPTLRLRRALIVALLSTCLVLSFHQTLASASPVEVVDEENNYHDTGLYSATPTSSEVGSGIELSSEETQSFFLSLAMIVVSEIGDKTFLIAAIMAMKHPRLLVFSAALSALAIMSVLSAAFGHAVPNLIPRTYTNYLAALLFFCFGIRMFYDGYYMTEEDAKHELEEVTQELQDKEDLEMLQRAEAGDSTTANQAEDARDTSVLVGMDPEPSSLKSASTKKQASGVVNLFQLLFSPVFVQTFIMTFLAEWGDRSQIATIALAAAHNMVWVSIGAVLGHSLCTGVAVIGGRMLASRISVRTVTLAGAVVFEIFAVVSLYESLHAE
ncbi:Ca2+/H+ antiporter, TMEM165/GDT1 family [Entomortierella parvispora]|uniref:GDT1 family protein n=1 Tax=Entomortierella parvispora TaxID=205924 RepID=A0A9P3LV87_9FUNG|nr:Ca2+/H+ antiporter, TMEM165/GDT1 family [Entomortierella parvispora]